MIVNERLVTYINSLDRGNTPFLNQLEMDALKNQVPIIRRETQSLLKVLLRIKTPSRILEVGTAVGFSALLMSTYGPENCRITTIENYDKRIPIARENFKKAGKEEQITLLEGDAREILKTLEEPFDFIFMDAAKGQYIHFLPDILRLLSRGGILISDNVLQDGDIIESHFAVERRNRTIYKRMREYLSALKNSDVIIGYTVYVDLVKEHFPGKEFMTTPMKKEVERCQMAFEEAIKGKTVSMICSGDAGVYGMAGLMYEVGVNYPQVELEIIPGVTAATGGAAVLGAPLIHDFCLISLSDLLTPWEKIETRLLEASKADFVICLYNPSSKKRHDYLEKACNLMMEYKAPDTVCGIVGNIGREGESMKVLTLEELKTTKVDMFTTVFVGNSQTKNIGGKMVTPRGYKNV